MVSAVVSAAKEGRAGANSELKKELPVGLPNSFHLPLFCPFDH